MYYYNYETYPAKYALKVYLGTSETIAHQWILNNDTSWNTTPKMTWPQNFQGSQKGEANRFNNERFMYFQTLSYTYIYFY